MPHQSIFKTIIFFLAAVILATLLTSVASSQLILAEFQSFGLEVSLADNLSTTIKDIVGLGPALLILISLSFFVSFIIAGYSQRFFGGNRVIWFVLAGLLSFPTTLLLMKYFMGLSPLASARTWMGLIIVSVCTMTGGWFYAILSARLGSKKDE